MKKLLLLFSMAVFALSSAQYDNINAGESLTYRIHYGFLTAGSATLTTSNATLNNKPYFYVKGVGQTSGAVKAFFKVNDVYESYINLYGQPYFYVRNVAEGSYRQHLQSTFNHVNHTVHLVDKKNTDRPAKTINTAKGVQDMLSSFYYLRNLDDDQLKVGNVIKMNVWIDDEMFPFQLRIAGTENVSTKFGKINCLKIIPSVMSGRVFKEKEGVTLWVSNDKNRVPILIKAELTVGAIKASIDKIAGTKYPVNFQK
ncbi:DUF3108 domain-containing protein [Chryseobacterium sp. TY3]